MIRQLNRLRYNWKWLLPMAVLGVFVPVTSCVLITVLLISFLAVRTSRIYKQTMASVRADNRVIDLIGSPIQPGLFVLGTVSRRVSGTMVNLTIPLYGSSARATAFVVAKKAEDNWQFTTLQVQAKELKTRINLLDN